MRDFAVGEGIFPLPKRGAIKCKHEKGKRATENQKNLNIEEGSVSEFSRRKEGI